MSKLSINNIFSLYISLYIYVCVSCDEHGGILKRKKDENGQKMKERRLCEDRCNGSVKERASEKMRRRASVKVERR